MPFSTTRVGRRSSTRGAQQPMRSASITLARMELKQRTLTSCSRTCPSLRARRGLAAKVSAALRSVAWVALTVRKDLAQPPVHYDLLDAGPELRAGRAWLIRSIRTALCTRRGRHGEARWAARVRKNDAGEKAVDRLIP